MLDSFLKLKQPSTRRACLTAILHLESYLGRTANFCTQEDAINYISEFRDGRSDATVLHRYHILRGYFEFLILFGQVDKNPFKIIPTLLSMRHRKQVRPTKSLSVEDIKKILGAIDLEDSDSRAEYSFLGLLFGGGLRRGEALAIRPCNVILSPQEQSYVELKDTKAGITQLQPIPKWVADSIRQVIKDRKVRATEKVFPWSEKTAYRIFRNRCLNVGINASPHSFRAAAATYLKEQGEEDRSVADFLRHKTTHMVQVYDHRARKAQAKTKQCLENFMSKKK